MFTGLCQWAIIGDTAVILYDRIILFFFLTHRCIQNIRTLKKCLIKRLLYIQNSIGYAKHSLSIKMKHMTYQEGRTLLFECSFENSKLYFFSGW